MRTIGFASAIILLGIVDASALEYSVEGRTIDVPVCGGFAGIPCKADQWCDFPSNHRCGIADQFGQCRARPQFCPQIFMPVCGCDGKSFNNACEAARAGTDVAHAGRCAPGG